MSLVNYWFLGLLAHFVLSSATSFDSLETCYEYFHTINDENSFIEVIERMKNEIKNNNEAKQTLLDSPYELSGMTHKLTRCAEELLKKSQFKALEAMIDFVLQPLNIDITDQIKMIGGQVKKQIDTIVNYASSKKQIQTINPVIQWAQSKNSIFIQVKFAHRHDAPGCLEVRTENMNFTENGLYYSGLGLQAHSPIRFVLNLTFHSSIVPEWSSFTVESVGRMFLNVTKVAPEIWLNLLSGGQKLPQMRIWWDMKQQYKDDMETFSKMLEEAEEKGDEGTWKRKEKKKKGGDASPAASTTVSNENPSSSEPVNQPIEDANTSNETPATE